MKNLLVILFTWVILNPLQAQMIEGTVYDTKTKEALIGVVIYLNGTSLYTTSDSKGNFKLDLPERINTALVLSHLSYEPLIIEKPYELRGRSFFLNEKVNTLAEAVIVADQFSRAQKMKAFKEQFLGENRAGRSCTILNEDDVVLNYDHNTNTLTGFSKNPLMIRNDYLAYIVTFDLFSFTVRYSKNRLSALDIQQLSFSGTSSFVDKGLYNFIIAERRNEIYCRSRLYFWKNFASNTLEEAKIKIYHGLRQLDASQYFTITDNGDYYIVETTIYDSISVIYNRKFTSEIIFQTDHFSIDRFGNIDAIDKIHFKGDMGKQRIGEMLPRDYGG